MPQSPGGAGPAHTLVSGQPPSMWPWTWCWFAPATAGLEHEWGLLLTYTLIPVREPVSCECPCGWDNGLRRRGPEALAQRGPLSRLPGPQHSSQAAQNGWVGSGLAVLTSAAGPSRPPPPGTGHMLGL